MTMIEIMATERARGLYFWKKCRRPPHMQSMTCTQNKVNVAVESVEDNPNGKLYEDA